MSSLHHKLHVSDCQWLWDCFRRHHRTFWQQQNVIKEMYFDLFFLYCIVLYRVWRHSNLRGWKKGIVQIDGISSFLKLLSDIWVLWGWEMFSYLIEVFFACLLIKHKFYICRWRCLNISSTKGRCSSWEKAPSSNKSYK